MQETYRRLIECHINVSSLEKALKKERASLITGYKDHSSSHSQRIIAKARYSGFAEALKKESAKFDQLVSDLEAAYSPAQAVSADAMAAADSPRQEIVEQSDCGSVSDGATSSGSNQVDLYRNSVPVTDNLSVDEAQIEKESDEKSASPQPHQPQTEEPVEVAQQLEHSGPTEQTQPPLREEWTEQTEPAVCTAPTVPAVSAAPTVAMVPMVNTVHTVHTEPAPAPAAHASAGYADSSSPRSEQSRSSEWHRIVAKHAKPNNTRSTKVKNGYKYKGNGFRLYSGKPIYSATTLFCRETCGGNESEMRRFLAEFGKFNAKKIGAIEFRHGQFQSYCLVQVRGPQKYIADRVETLNTLTADRYSRPIMHVFQKHVELRPVAVEKRSPVLFVNNFDILNQRSHRKMTAMFLRHGELAQDIEMYLDKARNPFALVRFRHMEDAQKCYEASKRNAAEFVFDGKLLDVGYRVAKDEKKNRNMKRKSNKKRN